MPMIETRDGTRLYTKIWGEGRPVVLIHGWPLSADSWDDQANAWAAAGVRVIAYDRRGFGRSDQPWHGYNYDTFADDLADVMKATGAHGAALVGFSMGGGEVARYLSRHGGDGVSHAVLISSVVPCLLATSDNPDGVPKAVFDDMAQQMKDDRAHFFTSFFATFYGVGLLSSPVSDEVLEWSRQVAMQAGLHPTLMAAQAFAATDFRPDLAAFTMPTLIIHGTADATVPIDPSGRAAARAIPGSRLVEIDGAPHGLLASHKTEVTDHVLHFLRS